jgi:hypothetical protein
VFERAAEERLQFAKSIARHSKRNFKGQRGLLRLARNP